MANMVNNPAGKDDGSDVIGRIYAAMEEHGHGCRRCAQVAIDTLRSEGWMRTEQLEAVAREAHAFLESYFPQTERFIEASLPLDHALNKAGF